MRRSQRLVIFAALACVIAGLAVAQGRHHMRKHTSTSAEPLKLHEARATMRSGQVAITRTQQGVRVTSNGVPGHAVGRFPNVGNPNAIGPQSYTFDVVHGPLGPAKQLGRGTLFGVAVNGVPFDPGAAEFWQGNPRLGWQYDALGGAVPLGLDAHHGHVQPNGAYHYHGLPVGLMAALGWRLDQASPLIGYAADGYPIYAITAQSLGKVVRMQSSYQLKPGVRPGGKAPTGPYDGAFIQDYHYVAGAGTLDACNGAQVVTADYPDGTYAYFLTEHFPVVPRCLRGRADASFAKRR